MRDGKFGKQYFSLREVKRLAKYNAEVIGSSEAGKILSISRVEIVKMTKAGKLRSVSRSNNDGLERHYKYLRSDVEKYKRKRRRNSLWQREHELFPLENSRLDVLRTTN